MYRLRYLRQGKTLFQHRLVSVEVTNNDHV